MRCFLYVNKIDRMSSTERGCKGWRGGERMREAEHRKINVSHLSIKRLKLHSLRGRTATEFCSLSTFSPGWGTFRP